MFWQSENILACHVPFCLPIQIFFGMLGPQFGLTFGSWHTTVSRPARIKFVPETLKYNTGSCDKFNHMY